MVGGCVLRASCWGGPGVKPMGLLFLHLCYNRYQQVRQVGRLLLKTEDTPLVWRTGMKWRFCCHIWRYELLLYFFLDIRLLALIGHLPAATWQPMTEPRGGHSLAHVKLLARSRCHITSCLVNLSCMVQMPRHLPCGCKDATWHFSIGSCVDLKMSNLSDTWQPLVLPHHHIDVIMTRVDL
jgi:hypothetical protein